MANFNETSLNMNQTTSNLLEPLFNPVLQRNVLQRAKHEMIYEQFGQKINLEQGKGKLITFTKMSPLPICTKSLNEGITPNGTAMSMTSFTCVPEQYGAYVATTDQFDYFNYNPSPTVLNMNELLSDNLNETMDTLTGAVLATGTNVQYAGTGITSRTNVVSPLTVLEVDKAVRTLKTNKAPKINGSYVAIIHTDVAYDLMQDPAWLLPNQYQNTSQLLNGEIGTLHGVRYVESPDAVVFRGVNFGYVSGSNDGHPDLQIYAIDDARTTITLADEITTAEATTINAATTKVVVINGNQYTYTAITSGMSGLATLTLSTALSADVEPDMKIYPHGGNTNGAPVYATFVLGANAYGVLPTSNKSLEYYTDKGGGVSDPLHQRNTMGWKCYHVAKILVNPWMVRIESTASRYTS